MTYDQRDHTFLYFSLNRYLSKSDSYLLGGSLILLSEL